MKYKNRQYEMRIIGVMFKKYYIVQSQQNIKSFDKFESFHDLSKFLVILYVAYCTPCL